MKLVMNSHDDVSVPAAVAAGGKLRLSDVVRALRSGEVELDCKAVLLSVEEDEVRSVFDLGRVAANVSSDVKLLLLHCGLHALASLVMQNEPEAIAAVAATKARVLQRREQEGLLELLGSLLGRDKFEAEDGKEVCHE